MVSHYKANWVPAAEFESTRPRPGRWWTSTASSGTRRSSAEDIDKWKPLTDVGAPVHVGEWGCYSNTPHDVCLAFMADEVSLWKEAGWGWSLWNLRGGFGVVDSGGPTSLRGLQGHKLDRKMLELIRAG
jgi:endoglucanase